MWQYSRNEEGLYAQIPLLQAWHNVFWYKSEQKIESYVKDNDDGRLYIICRHHV